MTTTYLTLPRFIRAKLLTLLEQIFGIAKTTVQTDHPGYTYIQKTSAINFRSAGSVGEYSDAKGKRYIIKDYAYKLLNLDYEYLHNEIQTLQILQSYNRVSRKIAVPEIAFVSDTNHRISIATKKIEAIPLASLQREQRAKQLLYTLQYLRDVSKKLSSFDSSRIPLRPSWEIYLTGPMYVLRSMFKETSRLHEFSRATVKLISLVPAVLFQTIEYGISHRDLSADNILIQRRTSKITILDTECMVRSDVLLDVSLIPRLFIRHISALDMLRIIISFVHTKKDIQRISVLMILGCFVKIATEQKGTRDYINAIDGLSLVLDTLIPKLELTNL